MECCCDVSCLRISVDREESKGITMAQRDNRLQNNSFVIGRSKPLFSVIFEALHLAQLGLMAGWWLAGFLADKMQVNL